jgi:hypothetical protein
VGSASHEAGPPKLDDLEERHVVGIGSPGALGAAVPLRYLTRMSPTKRWSSADFDAVIARVTPDILALHGRRTQSGARCARTSWSSRA